MCLDDQKIDIAEDEFLKKYPEILKILLSDRTTKNNIFWATDNYQDLGDCYNFYSKITIRSITGKNNKIITPRVSKDKKFQNIRIKKMAEVYTPAWVCNDQNNKIDELWFGKKNVFNKNTKNYLGWKTNVKKVVFPKGKTWKGYIKNKRLEIACGEAPYITSRYDTTTGEFIPVKERIGILDRKLRIVSENVNTTKDWLNAVNIAYKSTYAYEWQGDSLLLAREGMLYTFIENYSQQFGKKPSTSSIKKIADIISWNVWQMDGLTGTIPYSCKDVQTTSSDIFNNKNFEIRKCEGCYKGDINKHNGIYCEIKDWSINSNKDRIVKFIDIANG